MREIAESRKANLQARTLLRKGENAYLLTGAEDEGASISDILAALNMLGPVKEDAGSIRLETDGDGITLREENDGWLIGGDGLTGEKAVLVSKQLVRSEMCAGCGVCAASCPTGAIKLDGIPSVEPEKCIRCGLCFDSCVIHHYFNRIVELDNL